MRQSISQDYKQIALASWLFYPVFQMLMRVAKPQLQKWADFSKIITTAGCSTSFFLNGMNIAFLSMNTHYFL